MSAPTHTPVDLTDEQRANLAKLAAYLRTLPADYRDFDMSTFCRGGNIPRVVPCGTAACAVGHGPSAGVEPIAEDTSWLAYADRVFGADCDAHYWMFGGGWGERDNTVLGAAARIEHTLAHGCPIDADLQRCGAAPLRYTPEYQSALAALNAETNEMVALSNGRLG
jgi:hypothetical protein